MSTAKSDVDGTGFNMGHAVRKLRVRHLELLSLLAREKSVRAAASQMSLTQPALSKMLKEIEGAFGVELFMRSHSGVVPTAAGDHLIGYAIASLNALEAIGGDVDRIAGGEATSLRLGAFSVMPCVPRAIARLTLGEPHITVRVKEGTGVALLASLVAGELDCLVAALPPEVLQQTDVKSLRIEILYEDELCVVASRKNRFTKFKSIQWKELAGQRWALPPQESLLRRAVIDMHMRAGILPPLPVAEMMSPILLTELLALDHSLLGVMRLEQATVEQSLGRIARLPLATKAPLPPMSLITLRQRGPRDALIAKFSETLKAVLPVGAPKNSEPTRRASSI